MAVPAGAGWEVHFDAEAAACAELDLEAGVVGGGDRADDGQAEPMTVGVAGAVRADPLKWLESWLTWSSGTGGPVLATVRTAWS